MDCECYVRKNGNKVSSFYPSDEAQRIIKANEFNELFDDLKSLMAGREEFCVDFSDQHNCWNTLDGCVYDRDTKNILCEFQLYIKQPLIGDEDLLANINTTQYYENNSWKYDLNMVQLVVFLVVMAAAHIYKDDIHFTSEDYYYNCDILKYYKKLCGIPLSDSFHFMGLL